MIHDQYRGARGRKPAQEATDAGSTMADPKAAALRFPCIVLVGRSRGWQGRETR